MDLEMFGDRIVFKPLPEEEVYLEKVGSLFIPEEIQAQQKQQRRNYKGEAVIVGNECKFVKVGDTVAYDEYGVAEFFLDGEQYLIVRENDLIGKYK